MRLIRQRIEKRDGSGTATLLPEEPEDMVNPHSFFFISLSSLSLLKFVLTCAGGLLGCLVARFFFFGITVD